MFKNIAIDLYKHYIYIAAQENTERVTCIIVWLHCTETQICPEHEKSRTQKNNLLLWQAVISFFPLSASN